MKQILIEFLAKSVEYIINRYDYHKEHDYFICDKKDLYEQIATDLLKEIQND